MARFQGDHTAEQRGRLTINPLAHIDIIGTILVPIVLLASTGGRVGFGWAKPVPVNPYAFRHPRRGLLLVSLAGPASNVVLAAISGFLLRLVVNPQSPASLASPFALILISVAAINLFLAFFNLIPIPPLDGAGVISAILPTEYASRYESLGRYGTMLVLALIVLGSFANVSVIGLIIQPPAELLFRLFTGMRF
ncbi:MAG TPA: site-2 protease family protein [bacterium]|nr:site-2 protease family protein [bacterium]